jgi:glycosyltransferase involved in cell wall biosynthesis
MKVLHISPSFYPAFAWGGPIYSLHGLCGELAKFPDVELRVLTTDAATAERSRRLPIAANPVWFPEGYSVDYSARVWGSSIAPQLIGKIRSLVVWADVVHLTGVYSFPTIPTLALCATHKKPLVWSPRGALQRWSGSRKRILKWLWDVACETMLSPSRCVLHVTSEQELVESQGRISKAKPVVITNGVDIPYLGERRLWRVGGRLRLLYIGRLDPKKGLENLFHATARSARYVELNICGTGDADYVRLLRNLVSSLSLDERVTFTGHVSGEAKTSAFIEADVCVVPSYTENYGMVVAEALAHGIPVIASTGTPWAELNNQGAGKWVPNDPDSLVRAVEDLGTSDLNAMGQRGRSWMMREFAWDKIAKQMLTTYQQLSGANLRLTVPGQRADSGQA